MTALLPSSFGCISRFDRISEWRSSSAPARLPSTVASTLCLVAVSALLTGCHHRSTGNAIEAASPQAVEVARQQLALLPQPAKSRYMAIRSLSQWENPYLTVQPNMATLHVTEADANPSQLGVGGMLRPEGARRQNLDIRLSDLPTALEAVPEDSWPYGRVVAIEEAHDAPISAEPAVRRNEEATIQSLNDMGVAVYEWDQNGGVR